MPRIPLRDIPNAPQPIPQPTGGNLRRVNLGAAQSLLQRPEIPQGAFDGPARGMQALASGVGALSDTAGHFAKAAIHLQEQVDKNMLFRGINAITEAGFAAQAEIEQNSADYASYGDIMKRHLSGARDGFLKENPQMSEQARQMFEQEFTSRQSHLYGQAQLAGIKRMTEENKGFIQSQVNDLLLAGERDMAIQHLEDQRGGGLMTDQEINDHVKKAYITGDIVMFQALLLNDAEKALEFAENDRASSHLSPAQRIQLIAEGRTGVARQDGQRLDGALQEIDAGTLKSEKEIRERYGDGFFVRHGAALSRALKGELKFNEGIYGQIWRKIADFKPSEDPQERALQFENLSNEVRSSIPSTNAEKPLQFIKDKFDRKQSSQLESGLMHHFGQMLDFGFFGEFDKDKLKKRDEGELIKFNAASKNMMELKVAVDNWMKDNPRATPEEAMSYAQDYGKENGIIKIAPKGNGFWYLLNPETWGPGGSFRSPESKDELWQRRQDKGNPYQKGGGEWERKSGVTLPGGHKVTSYGYANDPYTDSNSRNGIGAWDNQLEDGLSFAASRDVEKLLRESGVEKGGLVEATLANGQTVAMRWDDRTAESVKGKALIGRWDIYNKKGLHPFDGVAVKSFRKVEA